MKNDDYKVTTMSESLETSVVAYTPSRKEVLGRMYDDLVAGVKDAASVVGAMTAFCGKVLVSPFIVPTVFRLFAEPDDKCEEWDFGSGTMYSVFTVFPLFLDHAIYRFLTNRDGLISDQWPLILSAQAASFAYEGYRAWNKKFEKTTQAIIEEKNSAIASVDLETKCLEENYDRLRLEYEDASLFEEKFNAWYAQHMASSADGKLATAAEPVDSLVDRLAEQRRDELRRQDEREAKFAHMQRILVKQ